MYKKNKLKFRIIVLSVIIICLVLSCFFINSKFNLPHLFVKDGVLGIDSFFNRFSYGFNKDYNSLIAENESLKKEIEEYKSYKSVNDELKNEILKLQDVVNIQTLLSDSKYVNGTVVNRNFDYWNQKLLINVGKKDGVNNNMAVLSNGSLIGITDDVSNNNSNVLLLTNKKFPVSISVKIKIDDKYVYGILNNYVSDINSFEVIGVVENIVIPEGSMVVTTGLGNIFPSGLLVGHVTSVTTDNFDLSKVITVKSDINFDDISYVTVLERN